MSEKLLDVKNLHTSFFTHLGEVQAIRDVSFGLDKGEIIGIVGESGSGKSVTSLSIMGLLAYPGRVKDGEILFNGEDLLKKKKSEMRKIQGDHIAMIFQDPMTSLNPLFKIGDQITEAILTHHKIKKEDAKKRALEMLRLVGIPSPEKRFHSYPHEFSGGMRQRAMIAMALSCEPENANIAFVKVDIDANQDLAQAAGIQAVPTLMIAKQGEVIFQQAGALQAADLDDLIAQAKALDLAAAKAAQSGADQQA